MGLAARLVGAVGGTASRLVDSARLRLVSTHAAEHAPRLEAAKGRLLARVVHVHDGDTVVVLCVQGGRLYRRRCRLAGIDAPELAGARAERRRAGEAREFLQCLLQPSTLVLLHFEGFDKYGRLLVNFRVGGRWVADQMVEHGHARRMGAGGRRLRPDGAEHQPPTGAARAVHWAQR